MTFENVREPRVNASALNSTTRTMTRKPSVATATKCPDSRISTRPTSHATTLTRTAAMSGREQEPDRDGADPLVEMDAGEPGRQVRQVGGLLRERQRQDRRDVRAERHEPDLAEREDAGEPARQVQRHGQDHEDREVDRRGPARTPGRWRRGPRAPTAASTITSSGPPARRSASLTARPRGRAARGCPAGGRAGRGSGPRTRPRRASSRARSGATAGGTTAPPAARSPAAAGRRSRPAP